MAGSLADAIAIYDLARETGTPCFSSSSLRFSPGIAGMKHNSKVGEVIGCDAYGPCHLEEHHPDLFWYGVHGVETLFTIMGTGCQTVSRVQTEGTELVTGVWKGGRVGTFRGIRQGHADYGAPCSAARQLPPAAGTRDISRWLSISASSFAPTNRRSLLRRRSRSSHSWKPPTRASGKGQAGNHRERHGQSEGRACRARVEVMTDTPAPRNADRYSDPGPNQQPTMIRYGVLAFLAAMTFVLYLDRVCMGKAAPRMQENWASPTPEWDSSSPPSRSLMRYSRSRRAGGVTSTGLAECSPGS